LVLKIDFDAIGKARVGNEQGGQALAEDDRSQGFGELREIFALVGEYSLSSEIDTAPTMATILEYGYFR
jgi:hypothetical protein